MTEIYQPSTQDPTNVELVVGTTPILGGNNNYILYNNNGILGEKIVVSNITAPGSQTNIPNELAVVNYVAGLGGGTVSSSGSAINNHITVYDGTTGFTIKDGGVALSDLVLGNTSITGGTHTKITYDTKGLVTSGADATTSDIAEGTNLYYTDVRVDARITLQKGAANGLASLDAGGKVPASELPASIAGGLTYKGTWDCSGGTYPTSPTTGDYYIASVAGTISGTHYAIGDWLVYNGTSWDKVDNSQTVSSVNGLTGTVVLTTANIADSSNKRYVTDANLTTIGNQSGTNTGDVTINATPNGLSIAGQVLSLALASTSTVGALSATNWNTFNSKYSGLPSMTGKSGYYLTNNGTSESWAAIPGGGDVIGPAITVDSDIALFDGTSGKLIKDSGKKLSDYINHIETYFNFVAVPLTTYTP